MRLFVAIELSEEMKKAAVLILHSLKQNGVKGMVRKSSGKPGKIAIPNTDMMVKKVSLMRSDNVQGKMVYKEIYHI